MEKSKPTRSKLTWDEILEIEGSCKGGWLGRPNKADIAKLIKHIRFLEYELDQARKIVGSENKKPNF